MTASQPVQRRHEVALPGLDGTNPLGFLAALGVLRVLSAHRPARMAWEADRGTWIPRIYTDLPSLDDVVDQLIRTLDQVDRSPWEIDTKLPFEAKKLRAEAMDAVRGSSTTDRTRADLLAGFGVEAIRDANGIFQDTSLRMLRSGDSAGNGLLAYALRIFDATTAENLRSALSAQWTYHDEGDALRWAPQEDRSYAVQWTDPSREKTVSVRAGNRLGLEAMALLPTVPLGYKVGTVAFGRDTDRREAFTWPIWDAPVGIDVVRSLLTLDTLQRPEPDRHSLKMRGVVAAYRCNRVMSSKYYRNLTPARRVV